MSDAQQFTLTVAGLTDVGKKRKRNEDSIRWLVPEPGSPQAAFGSVLLVCDGMGGVGQGDVASQTAVEQFFRVYYDTTYAESDTEQRVQRALEVAHNAVRDAATALGRLYIGTTAAGMVIRSDGSALSFNLGDSRVYRLRNGSLEVISKDQSVNAAQLERGEVTPEQAAAARNMNITMFIGHPLEMTPVYVPLTVMPGDMFMICSDGLWDVLPEKQLHEIVMTQPPEQAVRSYIDATLRKGAPDNVTVIVVSTRTHKRRRRMWPWLIVLLAVLGGGAFAFARNQLLCCTPPTDTTVTAAAMVEATDTETQALSTAPRPTNTAALQVLEVLPTDTAEPSATPTNTPPASSTPTETATATETDRPTPTGTVTETATRRPTRTPIPSNTAPPTSTPTDTATNRPTRTASATRTATPTATSTQTATETATHTATASATATATSQPTKTPTDTPPPTNTPTGTLPPTATYTPTTTSTSNPAFWVVKGTPTAALELVTVARFNSLSEPPQQIYVGNIERRFNSVTEVDPLDPGNKYVLVYLRANILDGGRFWWLIEDVQPQFEVLTDSGISVYVTASFAAARRSPIPAGELVIVTGISPNEQWFKIRSRRGEGWVPRSVLDDGLVRFLGDINDVPTVVPPPLGQAASATPAPGTTAQPTADTGQPQQPQPTSEPGQPTPVPPTSQPPTSQPPTSEPPTAEPPTSEPPTAEPPTSEPPTLQPEPTKEGQG